MRIVSGGIVSIDILLEITGPLLSAGLASSAHGGGRGEDHDREQEAAQQEPERVTQG